MDNTAELTAGALRLDPAESLLTAERLYFKRGYRDAKSMHAIEATLPLDERINYTTVVTPNNSHFPIAQDALNNGFGVLCEKPLTTNLADSQALVASVERTNLPFVSAYTYTGYPMVKLAREMVLNGDIGDVRKVQTWYPQGWLADAKDVWRVDPKIAGPSGCGGDIGTHAYEFIRYVTGLSATEVSAKLTSFVDDRKLDDDFEARAVLSNGAIATISASQVTIGSQNDNGFRIIGKTGTLEWSNTDHQTLKLYRPGKEVQVFRLGVEYNYFPERLKPYLRLPSGHPEGFHEALANHHRDMESMLRGQSHYHYPGVHDGAAGIAFIEACLESNLKGGASIPVAAVENPDYSTYK